MIAQPLGHAPMAMEAPVAAVRASGRTISRSPVDGGDDQGYLHGSDAFSRDRVGAVPILPGIASLFASILSSHHSWDGYQPAGRCLERASSRPGPRGRQRFADRGGTCATGARGSLSMPFALVCADSSYIAKMRRIHPGLHPVNCFVAGIATVLVRHQRPIMSSVPINLRKSAKIEFFGNLGRYSEK
jgi:hypothetical protein